METTKGLTIAGEDQARKDLREKIINYLHHKEFQPEDTFRGTLVDYIEAIEGKNGVDKSIVEILSKYHVMASLMGIEPVYNQAFLHSSEARRAMLSKHGCIICKDTTSKISTNEPDKEPADEKHFKVIDIEKIYKDVGGAKEELYSKLDEELEHVSNKDDYEVHYWWGCGMSIPMNNVKVVLSFTNAYPCVYIKKKKDEANSPSSDVEVFIEEGPWTVKYVDVEGILSSTSEDKGKNKYEPTVILKNTEKSSEKSNEITVSEALADCDILIQVPYINPLTDVLTKISFEKETEDVIILSCS